MTGAITKAIESMEQLIVFMEQTLRKAQHDYDNPMKIEYYACADCLCVDGEHSDECVVTLHRDKLKELKAFKSGVPEGLECDLKNSTTPMSSYNAYETERSVIDAAKHLLEGIAE